MLNMYVLDTLYTYDVLHYLTCSILYNVMYVAYIYTRVINYMLQVNLETSMTKSTLMIFSPTTYFCPPWVNYTIIIVITHQECVKELWTMYNLKVQYTKCIPPWWCHALRIFKPTIPIGTPDSSDYYHECQWYCSQFALPSKCLWLFVMSLDSVPSSTLIDTY